MSLFLEFPIPPSKNKKNAMNATTGGIVKAYSVTKFEEYIKIYQLERRREIDLFCRGFQHGQDRGGALIEITIQLYQAEIRMDVHNLNEILLDGIEEMIGINDKYFIAINKPRLYLPKDYEKIEAHLHIIPDPFLGSRKKYMEREKEKKRSAKYDTCHRFSMP